MKMNRTEWLMVILCGVAMIVLTMRQPQPVPAKSLPPTSTDPATPTAGSPATPAPSDPATLSAIPEQTVIKTSPRAAFTFTSRGGGISEIQLLSGRYAGKKEQLLNNNQRQGAIGALSREPGDIEQLEYKIDEQTDTSITYSAETSGRKIIKKWTLDDSSTNPDANGYQWKLQLTITNNGTEKHIGDYYLYSGIIGQIHKNDHSVMPSATWYADGDAGEQPVTELTASTGIFGLGGHEARPYLKKNLTKATLAGVHNRYYALVIRPDSAEPESTLWTQSKAITSIDEHTGADGQQHPFTLPGISAALSIPSVSIGNNETYTWTGTIYTGPRSGTVLNALAGERNQVMHYGMFRQLSRLFLGALNKFYDWVGVYGIALMLLTIAVRLCIWPLHMKATRAMKRMSLLAPMMNEIKEKYKDTPQKMQMEMMGLYRTYGVNPVGGCLPMLFQFPIFLGYFGMINTAVEMRGHSFLWAHDLTLPDTVAHLFGVPINPLPILMTITMYIQMAISPQPAQMNEQMAMQQKIMKFMPFMFLWFCYDYASALALYWTVQNIFGIFQTWLIKRQPEPELVKQAPKASFFERAMELQKQKQAAQAASSKKKPSAPRPGGSSGSAYRDQK